MDLATHALLGANGALALVHAMRPTRERAQRIAVGALGALAGIAPDADIAIRSSDDPLLVLEYHRHFTHSLVVAPVLALFVFWLVRVLLSRWRALWELGWSRGYLAALAGALLAGPLDACTSYGTHLLWPFVHEPVAWSLVAVVDPLVTIGLAVALAMALARGSLRAAPVGLLFLVLYLGVAGVQQGRARALTAQLAETRGHRPERHLVKPTLMNLVLWRSLYVSGDELHADAVRVGLFGPTRVVEGESAPLFGADAKLDWAPPASRAHRDVERFRRFADGYLVRDRRDPDRVGDGRYALLPTSLLPLWALGPPRTQDGPPEFLVLRDLDPETRRRLVDLLLGR
ncbi:MAG: metal-dependent hydrolase [Planctomycetaceae bacterium]|nr:metal-dependent hydrolase [Planctomycetaceae bacterium]